MAIRNTAWHKVKPGQIITFNYKGRGEIRSTKHTIILLNPDLRYKKSTTNRIKRFVVGLQLDTSRTRPLTPTKMEGLIRELGGVDVIDGAFQVDVKNKSNKPPKSATRAIYKRVDDYVRKNNNWRTFDRTKCIRNRVYLELDSELIPKDIIDEYHQKQVDENIKMMEEVFGED